MAKSFEEIIVWKKAHQLVLNIYRITKIFPADEKFGLISQMRRSSVSIASNIVEGFKRKGYRDALNFFNMSEASLEELKYQTLLSSELGYLNKDEYAEILERQKEVGRLLNSWQKTYYPKKALVALQHL